MNKDDAILAVIEEGMSVLLGCEPHTNKQMHGKSVVSNWRIKALADAIRDLREEFGYNQPGVGK